MSRTISFEDHKDDLILRYSSDQLYPSVYAKLGIGWDNEENKIIKYTLHNLPNKLEDARPSSQDDFCTTVKRIFHFSQDDLIEDLCKPESLAFKAATIRQLKENSYYVFRKETLGIDQETLLCFDYQHQPQWDYFGVGYEHRTSVFRKISDLTQPDVTQIIVGGTLDNAIPWEDFDQLLNEFPTTTYLQHYGENLISQTISDYLPAKEDYPQKYAEARRRTTKHARHSDSIGTPGINENLRNALIESRDILSDALKSDNQQNEDFWQQVVLSILPAIFPQYIAVLREAVIKEKISKPKLTSRRVDHLLIDAEGNVDILEIKCPFPKNKLMMSTKYRDNFVPARELSGGISQIEKYLYYLNHLGSDEETKFSDKCRSKLLKEGITLPSNMKLRALNPHGLLLIGNVDFKFDEQQDFDLIRRQYSHVADIITYNDLFERLNRILDIRLQPHDDTFQKS